MSGPPKCRTCGKIEWRHICLGAIPDEPKRKKQADPVANTKPEPIIEPIKPKRVANVVVHKVANRHGKYADLDKRRKYMRTYMADWRARKKAKSI